MCIQLDSSPHYANATFLDELQQASGDAIQVVPGSEFPVTGVARPMNGCDGRDLPLSLGKHTQSSSIAIKQPLWKVMTLTPEI